ncbi:MAG TPA: hypothetical protein VLK57_03850 [Pseudonocardia sp.]|nr:hypothetical protein [Pseudonocardia sp.]
MTAAVNTDQYVSLARRGQEITIAAAESFAGAFKAYADAVIPQGPRPVDPQAATVAVFDLAERLLTAQRTFAVKAIALVKEAGDSATAQASAAGETLKARTEQATERVIDFASETTRRAATTARNGVSV